MSQVTHDFGGEENRSLKARKQRNVTNLRRMSGLRTADMDVCTWSSQETNTKKPTKFTRDLYYEKIHNSKHKNL